MAAQQPAKVLGQTMFLRPKPAQSEAREVGARLATHA